MQRNGILYTGIMSCLLYTSATISNQKNTDENIESITAAQDRAEATLREVMEMSSRMETSVADITAELNKLETAFDSTKTAMEEVSAGSGESAAAIQQQTAQTEAIQEKVNTVGEVAETIGSNMEHTIEMLDAGKEEMTGLKEQAEDSARNSELAAQLSLIHICGNIHAVQTYVPGIGNYDRKTGHGTNDQSINCLLYTSFRSLFTPSVFPLAIRLFALCFPILYRCV